MFVSRQLGSRAIACWLLAAGWLAASATLVQLATIVVGYPQITELFGTNPVAVFFVHIAAATSLFLVLGTLLLLSRAVAALPEAALDQLAVQLVHLAAVAGQVVLRGGHRGGGSYGADAAGAAAECASS